MDQTIESLYISTEDVDVTRTNHDFDHSKLDMQPQKKAKYDPFTWFQTDNSTTLSTTNQITNIDSLVKRKYSCIFKKWFQNERISTYLIGGIIINFNTHYCRRLQLLVIQASSSESDRHFSAFNARNIITSQRNSLLPETIEAVSVVLEGYKNNLIS